MPQPLVCGERDHAVDVRDSRASRSGVKCAAICVITVAEQLTDDRMPMKLRVPTRPSARTMPMKVARSASGT